MGKASQPGSEVNRVDAPLAAVHQPDVLVLRLRISALHGHSLAIRRNGECAVHTLFSNGAKLVALPIEPGETAVNGASRSGRRLGE